MRMAVVLGTRPEITKLAPVIWTLEAQELPYALIHTGQHYTPEMDSVFFEQLWLPEPVLNLHAGEPGARHGAQTGAMLGGLETAFADLGVDRVMVLGDTNTVLAGALVAAKMHLPIGHVEAGLRSYDRTMPEEVNRVVADHVATQLYAPTKQAVDNLAAEGLRQGVLLTGNTIVDTVLAVIARTDAAALLAQHGLQSKGFVFLTLHRQENTDNPERLESLLQGLKAATRAVGLPLVYSMHYRTKARIAAYGLERQLADIPGLVLLHPPVDLLQSLAFQRHARLVLTDSGGLQEESCILGTPCVTLRENTERPETIELGCNVLAGWRPAGIVESVERMMQRDRGWPNPFGDGKAAQRCVAAMFDRPDLDPGELRPPAVGVEGAKGPWS
ncbi:MAG: UDP-N-acetylglucosamine 2-epimerase (non-hydrolyzing) [Bacillota bacterium]|nr:UDP-N-acetylglucosamine 2-epimerase (non-hydrolyzing) [Bacillota bacterium]